MTYRLILSAFLASAILFAPRSWAEDLAVRPLPRGTILTAADLSGGNPDLIGLEVIRHLRKGQAVDRSVLREPHIVKRNDRVALVFVQGRLRLETTGRSLESGALGDRVTVMNMESRQKVFGYVNGPETVEVRP